MTDGILDAAVDLAERVLETGIVLVLQVRRTPHGRHVTVGFGTLNASEALLLGAAASRLLRRRHEDVARRHHHHHPERPEWPPDPLEDL